MNEYNGTVLLVEDEGMIREVIPRLLEIIGYHTITAENGEEGLDKFKTKNPDVVLTDIDLGNGITGVELSMKIREINPEATIYLMSGREDRDHERKYTNGFIQKPMRLADLEGMLKIE